MRRLAPSLLLLAALTVGCNDTAPPAPASPVKMRVGVVDTTRILQELSQYKDLQSALVKERAAYMASLQGKDPKKLSKEQVDQLRLEAQKKQGDWQKRTAEMVQQSVKQITELTAEVARQKNLDLVVISTPFTNTIHYHDGQDITTDVILKLNK